MFYNYKEHCDDQINFPMHWSFSIAVLTSFDIIESREFGQIFRIGTLVGFLVLFVWLVCWLVGFVLYGSHAVCA